MQMEFTEPEQQAFHDERFHHPPPRVPQKMAGVWLKSQGLPHHEIARLAGVCENRVRTSLEAYQEGGSERLKQLNFHRPQSELVQHQVTIEAAWREQPPAPSNEAVTRIEQLTGSQRSPTQVRQFLRGLGLRCRPVGVLPAQADPPAQERFQKTRERRAWGKRKRGSGWLGWWTRHVLCWEHCWAGGGVGRGCLSKRRRGGSGATGWGRSTRSRTSESR